MTATYKWSWLKIIAFHHLCIELKSWCVIWKKNLVGHPAHKQNLVTQWISAVSAFTKNNSKLLKSFRPRHVANQKLLLNLTNPTKVPAIANFYSASSQQTPHRHTSIHYTEDWKLQAIHAKHVHFSEYYNLYRGAWSHNYLANQTLNYSTPNLAVKQSSKKPFVIFWENVSESS